MARRLALPMGDEERDRRAEFIRDRRTPAKIETTEKARRAYEYMRDRTLPSLAPYARARTRNPNLKVELTAGTPRTDSKTIWLRPDIRLGDLTPHVKSLCGLRDRFDMQLCKACQITEGVFATMAHEVSHMVEGSFTKIDTEDSERLMEILIRAENECTSEVRKLALRKRFEANPPTNYAEAANLISPWLLLVINGIEDARVNTAAYKAGPGLYKIFRADLNAVLREGIHADEDSVVYWRDQAIEAQLCCALYVKLSQMADYKEFFADEVVEVLDTDKELLKLQRSFTYVRSIEGAYELGVKVLERLRELGYMRRREEDAEEAEAERELKVVVLVDDDGESGDEAGEDDGRKPDLIVDMRTRKPEPKAKPEASDEGDGSPEGDGKSAENDSSVFKDERGHASDEVSTHGSRMGAPSGDEESDRPMRGASSASDAATEHDGDDDDFDDDFNDEDETDTDEDDFDDMWGEADDADTEGACMECGAGDGEEHWPGCSESDDESDRDYDDDDSDMFADEFDSTERVDPYADVSVVGIEELDIDFAKRLMEKLGRHEPTTTNPLEDTEISRAVSQGDWIDEPTTGIFGVRFLTPARGDIHSYRDVEPDALAIAGAVFRTRTIFSDNRKANMDRNLRTGKINTRVLGRRAPVQDERLFHKRRLPSEKSYFVLIGLDLSGSTGVDTSQVIKQAARNQAELLSQAGIDFAMYGHTGDYAGHAYDLHIYVIKEPGDRWDEAAKQRLNAVGARSANLDGHTMEVYRKIIERQRADRKLVLYYTDGAMPCENFDDETRVLIRELAYCKRNEIEVIGIGIGNDDPSKYGLETVRIDRADEVHRVLDKLEEKLTK